MPHACCRLYFFAKSSCWEVAFSPGTIATPISGHSPCLMRFDMLDTWLRTFRLTLWACYALSVIQTHLHGSLILSGSHSLLNCWYLHHLPVLSALASRAQLKATNHSGNVFAPQATSLEPFLFNVGFPWLFTAWYLSGRQFLICLVLYWCYIVQFYFIFLNQMSFETKSKALQRSKPITSGQFPLSTKFVISSQSKIRFVWQALFS